MGQYNEYLMESSNEALRLDVKTDPDAVRDQAVWCGVGPDTRVLDLGCGSGITTSILHSMVMPGGSVVGVDYSDERLAHARHHYGGKEGIEFVKADLTGPIEGVGTFDIIWVRFVLEYFRQESAHIVQGIRSLLKPGGYLCLIDLDCNCLNHYELPRAMEDLLTKLTASLDADYNFDTYAGRKLYSYLFDADYECIDMKVTSHHLIYGDVDQADLFNWLKKIEVGSRKLKSLFEEYPGGAEGFREDFEKFFTNPRRFTYTPLIMAKGRRPYEG